MSFDIVSLHEWASKNGHEIVFTILMEPIENRSDRHPAHNYDSVECVITETRYKVSDNHKMTLRPIVPGYGEETFYYGYEVSYEGSSKALYYDCNASVGSC